MPISYSPVLNAIYFRHASKGHQGPVNSSWCCKRLGQIESFLFFLKRCGLFLLLRERKREKERHDKRVKSVWESFLTLVSVSDKSGVNLSGLIWWSYVFPLPTLPLTLTNRVLYSVTCVHAFTHHVIQTQDVHLSISE